MNRRRTFIVLACLGLASSQLQAQTWDRYRPGKLSDVIARHEASVRETSRPTAPNWIVSQQDFPTSAHLVFLDSSRALSPEARQLLRLWSGRDQRRLDFAARFEREYLFREDSLSLWVPVQASLEPPLHEELSSGSTLTAAVMWIGAHSAGGTITWLFLLNAWQADSP